MLIFSFIRLLTDYKQGLTFDIILPTSQNQTPCYSYDARETDLLGSDLDLKVDL